MRLAGTFVPVAGVGVLTLDSMQVSVHPGASFIILTVGLPVYLLAIVLCLMPQCL